MDKNTATGLVLIFLLMIGWFYFTMPSEEELAAQRQREQAIQDSLALVEQQNTELPDEADQVVEDQPVSSQSIREQEDRNAVPQSGLFSKAVQNEEERLTVTTDLYTMEFTSKGAGPSSFLLNNYNTWDGEPVQMIRDTSHSAYNIGFLSTENYNVETQNMIFESLNPETNIRIEEGGSKEVRYRLQLEDGRQVLLTYLLNGNNYEIDLDIQFVGLSDYVVGNAVDFGWTSPLNFTEKDKVQDALATSAYVYLGGELENIKLTEPQRTEPTFNGTIDWVATKTKFFTQLIKPMGPTEAALVTAELTGEADNPESRHLYTSSVRAELEQDGMASFKLYVGPMKYNQIKQVDDHAYDMVDVGWSWLRWFSDPFVRFLVIPFFEFMSSAIGSVGFAIVIFAAGVKLVLSPLTFKSYKSMAAMRELQPQLKEVQEKYKENPQKQQQETMKLYKKNKVNPLGGCLPNLLQFPILITLWRYFQNSILIRQEEFLWAGDLSAPDYIISLPFSIPFLGEQIAGFVLLMTAAMVVQSRLTGGMSGGGGGSNPMAEQMKVLQYIFPVMLLFIFNNFAAGLSLYYLVFNVLSIIQQFFINRSIGNPKEAS